MATSPVHNQSVIPPNRAAPFSSIQSTEPSDQQARTDVVAQRLINSKASKYKEINSTAREEKKAKKSAYDAAYSLLHRAKKNEASRKYYQRNKEEIIAKQIAYNRLHKAEKRVYDTAYKKLRKEKIKAQRAAYYAKFKKEYAERKKSQNGIDSAVNCEEDRVTSTSPESSMISSSAASIQKPPFPELSQDDENPFWNNLPEQLNPQSGHWPEIVEPLGNFFD